MDRVITINVGGKLFTTLISTLIKASHFFQNLFSGNFIKPITDDKGYVFIDRDPKYFSIILNYIRTTKLDQSGTFDVELLIEEFNYYGIRIDTEIQSNSVSYLLVSINRDNISFGTSNIKLKNDLINDWNNIININGGVFIDNIALMLSIITNRFSYELVHTIHKEERLFYYVFKK